jgi:hypothetical protein
MAKNTNKGRKGWIRFRSQYFDDLAKTWLKRDTQTGRIIDSKKGEPWKGIRMERGFTTMIQFPAGSTGKENDYREAG